MSKKGFTLVELLVVIAIIAVLSIIIIPSVINVNKGINERLYNGKVENIESSAVLYATNNVDMFNGQDEVIVYVYELINSGYVTVDVKVGSGSACTSGEGGSAHGAKGCVIDPRYSGSESSLNGDYIIIRKSGGGYTAEYVHNGNYNNAQGNNGTPIEQLVCTAFENKSLVGQVMVGNKKVRCKCDQVNGPTKLVTDPSDGSASVEVDECLVSGENPNNYLRYGDTKANWRVLGLYKLDGSIHAKMITNEPI